MMPTTTAAPTAYECTDDPDWHEGSRTVRTCSWVAEKTSRCKYESNQGVSAYEACPVTCGTCPTPSPTASPTLSPQPTMLPTTTYTPTAYECTDDPDWHDGSRTDRTCNWVTGNTN